MCNDLPVLDAVLDVGLDPVFDVGMECGTAVDEGDARAVTPEIKSCDCGGILAADDEDVLVEVGMRFVIVMLDLGKIFAGNAEVVWQVIVAGGDDELAGAMDEFASELVGGLNGEVAIGTGYVVDVFVLADVEAVVLGDLAVVLEGLGAGRLLVGRGEGHVADLEQLGRGEEGHVSGVIEERVGEATLVHENDPEAVALGCDGAGEAGRAGANDEDVEVGMFAHSIDCMDALELGKGADELGAKFAGMGVKLGHEDEGSAGSSQGRPARRG